MSHANSNRRCQRNALEIDRVLGSWRQYEVKIVRGLDQPYVIEEKWPRILIRLSWLRPWRMLAALIEAMNEISGLDEQWAIRSVNKRIASFLQPETVTILGETWKIVPHVMLDDVTSGTFTMIPFEIDEEAREILISSRYNLSFGAPELIRAIVNLQQRSIIAATHQAILEVLRSPQNDRGGTSRSNVTHSLAGKSEQTRKATPAAA